MGFVTVLVGVILIPTVATAEHSATYAWNGTAYIANVNVSGASAAITGLTTLFFTLGVIAAGIAMAVAGLREAGIM